MGCMWRMGVLLTWLALTGGARAETDLAAGIAAASRAIAGDVVAWRRDIHQHPELSNREERTGALVAAHLRALGLEVQTGVAHTGVVAILRGGLPGPVVALRADMDALPVEERTGLPFASTERATYEGRDVGVMHACGHDAHVAILMGAAAVLAGMRESIPGTVKFIFQPAEEGAPPGEEGGAGMMVASGVLRNPAVDAIFGLHVNQTDAVGEASYRPRGAMASAQRFDITVHGRQTHGAQPWAGVDPIVAGAQIVTALQTIVSRSIDVTRAPAVVTVGTFHAGVRDNIVPDVAKLSGTIRSFDPAMKEAIHADVKRIATAVAESMGATAEVEIEPGVPVTYNDAALTAAMVPTLQAVYGTQNVRLAEPITGAEDFSFYQEKVPGFFFFVGVRPKDVPAADGIPNHSPLFDTDEAALPQAVEVMSRMAVDYLQRHPRVAAESGR
jgi:amidohydrolase